MAGLYPILNSVSKEEFYAKCQAHFPKERRYKQRHESQLEEQRIESFPNEPNQPPMFSNTFFYKHLHENEGPKKGRWSEEETEHLKNLLFTGVRHRLDYITNDHEVNWGILSLRMSGRTGSQCYDKYRSLLEQGQIPRI